MTSLNVKTEYSEYKDCKLRVGKYVEDNSVGDSLYCTPRTNLESGEYETCEVGFPNQREELLMPYAEDPETPTETVYGYVPVTLVEQIIDIHGGWFESKIPFA